MKTQIFSSIIFMIIFIISVFLMTARPEALPVRTWGRWRENTIIYILLSINIFLYNVRWGIQDLEVSTSDEQVIIIFFLLTFLQDRGRVTFFLFFLDLVVVMRGLYFPFLFCLHERCGIAYTYLQQQQQQSRGSPTTTTQTTTMYKCHGVGSWQHLRRESLRRIDLWPAL